MTPLEGVLSLRPLLCGPKEAGLSVHLEHSDQRHQAGWRELEPPLVVICGEFESDSIHEKGRWSQLSCRQCRARGFKGDMAHIHETQFRVVRGPLASISLVAHGCWISHKVLIDGQETGLFLERRQDHSCILFLSIGF